MKLIEDIKAFQHMKKDKKQLKNLVTQKTRYLEVLDVGRYLIRFSYQVAYLAIGRKRYFLELQFLIKLKPNYQFLQGRGKNYNKNKKSDKYYPHILQIFQHIGTYFVQAGEQQEGRQYGRRPHQPHVGVEGGVGRL